MRLTTVARQDRRPTSRPDSRSPGSRALVATPALLTFLLDRNTDAAPGPASLLPADHHRGSRLRWVGGLVTSLVAILLYHLANSALLTFAYRETDFVQIALFIAVGVVTARLTENARRLHVLAMTDDLTGLHNLRSFESRLPR